MSIQPRAYGYARVSSDDQAVEDSLPGQIARVEAYWNMALRERGIEWGGVEWDQYGVSAFKKSFSRRPAGLRLLNKLHTGDHIIFDKVDRVWRRNDDFVDLMRLFKDRGITAHFVSLRGCSCEMGTPMGDFVLNLMVLLAELESKNTSARNTEINEFRRLTGKINQTETFGWQIVGRKTDRSDDRQLIEDQEEQLHMKLVFDMREKGTKWEDIAYQMECFTCAAEGVPVPKKFDRTWKITRLKFMYGRYRVLQLWKPFGGFDPVRYKIADGLVAIERVLNRHGQEAAIEAIKKMVDTYVSRSSVLLHSRLRRNPNPTEN